MSNKQPNILFAFADDWGRYASVYRQVEGDQTLNALLEAPILTASPTTARCSPTLLYLHRPALLVVVHPLSSWLPDQNYCRYQMKICKLTAISVQQVIANLHPLAYILGHYIGHLRWAIVILGHSR